MTTAMDVVKDNQAAIPDTTQPPQEIIEVIIHPLVLLSTVDHYNRVAKDTRKRVVGVLLGTSYRGRVDVTNSFAVPFEEDLKNPRIWYLDHNYLESMFAMFKKINAKERILGFYSTGPKAKENDLQIDDLFRRFCRLPIFVIIDVRSGVEGIPVTAYVAREEVEEEGKEIGKTFEHITSSVGALEAEEVGVEHLLRDINDPSVSTLANQIKYKLVALAGLRNQLDEMRTYLRQVSEGKLPINHQITYNLQTIFNLLPNLNIEDMIKSLLVKTNDMHFVIYLSSLIRSIVALHDVVQNKIQYRDQEEGAEGGKVKEGAEDAGEHKKDGENAEKKEVEKGGEGAVKNGGKKEAEKK